MKRPLPLPVYSLALLLCLAAFSSAEDKKDMPEATASPSAKEEPSVAEKVIGKAIEAMVGTDGKLSVETLQAIRALAYRRETSERIDGKIEGKGFHKLEISAARGHFVDVPAEFLVKKLTMEALFPDHIHKLSSEAATFLRASLETAREFVAVRGGAVEDLKFDLKFEDGSGQVRHVAYGVSRLENGNYSAYRGYMEGSFEVAPDYLVMYKSKKGLTTSRSWYEIVPLKPQLTKEKTAALFASLMPQIAFAMGQIVPPASPSLAK